MKSFLHTLSWFLASLRSLAADELTPTPIPDDLREKFRLAPFYQKHASVGGLPIVGSAKVTDAALAECAWLVRHMLSQRADLLAAMAEAGVRFAVMAHDEYTTDLPEHAHLKPRVYWDRRARGLGATPSAPAVSGGEENLLAFPGDPYPREIICIHEFAHAIHEMGLRKIDPTFDDRLRAAYEKALAGGLWKGTYAAVNRQEYWAEAVQAWFDNNAENDALHNAANTRAELQEYDPTIAALCAEVFRDIPWRYRKPADRAPEGRAHLRGFDSASAPRFAWRREPVPERARVSLQCAAGEVEFEFEAGGDREGLEKFLWQVQSGYFSSGRVVFRAAGCEISPAAQLPTGEPVPPGEGRWKIGFGSNGPATLRARITKGGVLLPRLVEESGTEGVRAQRIVRLN